MFDPATAGPGPTAINDLSTGFSPRAPAARPRTFDPVVGAPYPDADALVDV